MSDAGSVLTINGRAYTVVRAELSEDPGVILIHATTPDPQGGPPVEIAVRLDRRAVQ